MNLNTVYLMSFDDIYQKYYTELRRFGRQLNLSAENSEDIIQDTFVKFYLELKKNVEFRNPRAWLYKVFLNHFKTSLITERRRTRNNEVTYQFKERTTDPGNDYLKNEQRRIVIGILDKMESHDKEILLLYHNGFSYAEMAEILGMNPSSVGKTLVRAIDRLKEKLKIQYHEMFEQN